jgi:uncharacterized protein (DUF433 family)
MGCSLPNGDVHSTKSREAAGAQILSLSDIIGSFSETKGGDLRKRTSNPMGYDERIIRDIQICGGEPVFKGTRVTLRTVLPSLAAGGSAEDILSGFPSLKPEDIQAAIVFAAASAQERLPVGAIPRIR